MNWYPWLNAPYRQLIAQYQAGRGHHALLIHADEGNGDAALVYGLSRWLLCQHPQGEKSCGECHSCRLMLAGNHPDWHVLTPEKGKASLGIDRVRQVIDGLYTHAQQGGAKVIWLAQAEALTEAAANALLKTLEEPPEKTYFLLGCRTPSRLLPTLRSRCSYWHLQNPPPALSSQWIQRQQPADPQSVETALKLSHGAPLAAAALLQPERWQQRQQLCRQLSSQLTTHDLLALLPVLNHEDAAERLHWLCTLLLDAMKWQQGAAAYLLNQDQQPLVAALAATLGQSALQSLMQGWLTCRHQLLTVNAVNRELLLTEHLLAWEALLAAPDSAF
ncbi:DNA polymerase III subunit delta' [Chimaeribacter arupi]|uniref:DNA polymerase III subunit delta' n=2 Tax=Yersiniaceae TaxID=1903411 RepID=A0A2N5ETB1_9GAMM|nr:MULTISPECIES: DNA polymerase III subunit delta' [Yersiniaceae]MBS0969905.1 DNA polymerase III subunit delta' [Nissabacter archeti]MDV5139943.1 DNA polymerase III subunit delta' [Chimaeribacter arupi]PLR49643.1 DNA polymerase III subunit delta' [Chimaeribacter arupi]PLR53339.1 DNA polymerase III subunit delta' [Chimaeribacter arupi]WKZ91031.1 DNA polymerase III subunit delta' [Chimaeribacter arupi]